MYQDFEQNKQYLKNKLQVDVNFDVISRDIIIGNKKAVFFFINGFCKDEVIQKLLQYLMGFKESDLPKQAADLNKVIPYIEAQSSTDEDVIIKNIMSGIFAVLIDGYEECLLIDARSYPARSVQEPEKDKVMRGSRDGFVETLLFNANLIRRRIRSPKLTFEIFSVGNQSKTDVSLAYVDGEADPELLDTVRNRLKMRLMPSVLILLPKKRAWHQSTRHKSRAFVE